MASINIDEDTLYRAGVGVGYAFAQFFRGLHAGVEEFELEQAALKLQSDDCDAAPPEKTNIAECRACWCDRCAEIERCDHRRDGAAKTKDAPNPCAGCVDGMRLFPIERPPCPDFREGGGFNHG